MINIKELVKGFCVEFTIGNQSFKSMKFNSIKTAEKYKDSLTEAFKSTTNEEGNNNQGNLSINKFIEDRYNIPNANTENFTITGAMAVELLAAFLKKLHRESKEGEADFHWTDKGKLICNHTKNECPVNDTVAGSSCSLCKQFGYNGVPIQSNNEWGELEKAGLDEKLTP